MLGNVLPFVGNCYVYLIVFANTYQISNMHPFVIFNSNTSNVGIQIQIRI